LYIGQQVWLSVDGSLIRTHPGEGGRVLLGVEELPGRPLTPAPLSAQVFRIDPVDRRGVIEPGGLFRLRMHGSRGQMHTVVVRDEQLVVEAGVIDDPVATFAYSQLWNLDQYWNADAADNAIFVGTPPAGYTHVRTEGRILVAPRAGTVPLKQFYSSSNRDTLTTATVEGQETAVNEGYAYRGIIGWAYQQGQPTTRIARQYGHAGRRDIIFTATMEGERSAADYLYLFDDCHVFPPTIPRRDSAPASGLGVVIDPAKAAAVNAALRGGSRSAPLSTEVTSAGATPAPPVKPDPGKPSPAVAVKVIAGADLKPAPGWLGDPRLPVPPAGAVRRSVRALVLGGGGAKGAFEAGAIQALWNDGYRPDIVCGVSVGAVNALKVAEKEHSTGNELVRMWRDFSSDPSAIYLENLYVDLLRRAADAAVGAARDTGIATLVGNIAMNLFAPGSAAAGMDLAGALTVGLIAGEASDLSDHARRLLNLGFMTHALHCMDPLRRLLSREAHPERIIKNRMRMRLGITDARTGCFFSVTEPFADGQMRTATRAVNLFEYGLLDVEPDLSQGGNWLTQPAFACNHYAMRIVDATYASAVMPVFMEPLHLELRNPELVAWEGARVGLLAAHLPQGVSDLIAAAAPEGRLTEGRDGPFDFAKVQEAIDRYSMQYGLPGDAEARSKKIRLRTRAAADGLRGAGSTTRVLFDGGLVDSIPIRTAIRMGATEILVIGVDQLGVGGSQITSSNAITQYSWLQNILLGEGMLGGLEPAALPAVQYLFAMLMGFVLGTTRGDMLSALGNIDRRRTAALAAERMAEPERGRFVASLRERSAAEGLRRRALLGGATSLGGFDFDDYGSPADGNIAVDVILPDRPLLDSLGFADHAGVVEAIELGRIAARSPVSI
jgi:predicted acylesterase/phospholipase RssA